MPEDSQIWGVLIYCLRGLYYRETRKSARPPIRGMRRGTPSPLLPLLLFSLLKGGGCRTRGPPWRSSGFLTIGLFDGQDPRQVHLDTLAVIELGERLAGVPGLVVIPTDGAWADQRAKYSPTSPRSSARP